MIMFTEHLNTTKINFHIFTLSFVLTLIHRYPNYKVHEAPVELIGHGLWTERQRDRGTRETLKTILVLE